ncbi:hypothetical protein JCM8097_003019 [Rhodosporidiobolus ruineniae]
MDATLVTATRQPLIFTTPSSSFSQSRLEKGRLSAIPPRPSSASSAMNTSPSKPRLAQPFTAPPFAATPRAGAGFPFFAGVGTPTSPSTSSIFAVPLSSSPPADERMRDPSECETPPMSRTIPSSNLRGALSVETSSPTTGLMSKKGKNKGLQSPTLPLTPPLTPPYQEHHALLPAVELPSSPSPAPAPVPPPKPTTVSGRALLNHRLHPLFASSYSLCEELGSGGFGFVVRAERSIDQFSVAVKFIERAKIPSHGWVKSRSWGETPGLIQPPGPKLIPMEAFVLRSIRHEGVVAFIDLFEDDKYFYLIMEHHGSPWQPAEKPPKESLSRSGPADLPALASSPMQPTLSSNLPRILNVSPTSSPILMASHHAQPPSPARLSPPRPASMERRSSCDLFECIEAHSRFDERTARYVFAQVVEIIYALGQMGIVHRDLKDENLVIDAAYRVKLIDFGSAVIFDPREPPPKYTRFHGTTSFASAEILRGEKYQAPSSEVWSLGVLLSILVTGECPFADAEAAKAGRISRPKVRLAPEVEHLLRKCLEVDVASRITISEIRRHPWLAGVWAPRH